METFHVIDLSRPGTGTNLCREGRRSLTDSVQTDNISTVGCTSRFPLSVISFGTKRSKLKVREMINANPYYRSHC